MKKNILVVLVVFTMLFVSGNVWATEKVIVDVQSSSVFLSYSSGITSSSGNLICSSVSTLTSPYYTNSITMQLQKYENGSWVTVKTWYDSVVGQTLDLRGSYVALSGIYRVMSTHSAGGEAKTSYSKNYTI